MAVSAGTAWIDILPNMAQFAAATAAGMRKVGPQLAATGARLSRTLTLPLIAAGTVITKLSLNFSDAMTNIRALVGASDKQMEQYRAGVLKLATETTKGPTELAESLYFLASAGFEGEKALRVLSAAARASSAGLGDTQQVAQTVGAAVNAYGEKALKASEATDVLVATVREGTAEPAELAGALGRVIAPAQAVGVSFQEVGGAVAGLTLTGLDASESVTALRGILVSFLGPGTQAKETLEEFGSSAKEVQDSIAKDGLLVTLQGLRDRFDGNNDAMRKLFPNVRAFNGFLALTGRNAEKNAKAMDEVVHSTGDADAAFQKASESVGFKFRNAIADLQVSLLKFGDILLPIVAEAASKIADLADRFGDLSPEAQKMIVWAGIIAAALGPIMFIVGTLTTAVGGLVSAFVNLQTTSTGAVAFSRGWATVLATNPWVAAAAVVAGLALTIYILGQRSDEAYRSMQDLTDATRGFTDASGELNKSARDVTRAQLEEKSATIAVKEARQALNAVQKDDHASKLDIRRATNNLQLAELNHADALNRVNEAEGRNRRLQGEVVKRRTEARENLRLLNEELAKDVRLTSGVGRANQAAAGGVKRFIQNMDVERMNHFVDGLIENAAAYGRTQEEASTARKRITEFIRESGKIPSEKQLQILVDNASANEHLDQTRRLADALPRSIEIAITASLRAQGALLAGQLPGNNAGGTDNWRGGWSWVGERGPELLNIPRGAQVIPNHEIGKRGGRQRLVIDNWDEGTGYIEDISDDSVSSAGRLQHQTRRMRRP